MKDNLNIEELFKEKLGSLEGDVNPDVWANIQQGMSAAGVGGATAGGMSLLLKTVIISGGIVAATFGGVYLFSNQNETNTDISQPSIVVNDANDNAEILNDNVFVENNFETETQENNGLVNLEETAPLNSNSNVNSQVNYNSDFNENNGVLDQNTTDDSNTSTVIDNTSIETNTDNTTTITNSNPDSNSGNINGEHINVLPTGSISVEEGEEFAPSTYTFYANAENASTIMWEFEDGSILYGETVEYTFEKPGTYNVNMVITGKGEQYKESKTIKIESSSSIGVLANIFSPNGDRINDFFVITSKNIETFYITIRDLKGNVLFESNEVDFRWYGTDLGGNKMPNGEYLYQMFAKGFDGTEFKNAGTITIQEL